MKSKEEILNDFGCPEVPFNENVTMYYPAILSAMEEYASQQAPASTPPVSANDMTAEEFFNHPDGMFTLNFLTKEEQETLYKAIDLFVVGKIRQTMLSAPVSAMEDGWVNVEDKLPEEEEWVLVYNNLEENCAVTTGVFVKGRWGILELGVDAEINVTHWRPLPPPPSNR